MNAKGAVICFQKYVLGHEWEDRCLTPGGPVCLGYMGRVDVQTVHEFKDFIAIASKRGANYACTRKQLLVYQLDEELDRSVDIVEFDGPDGPSYPNDGRLPFCSAAKREFFALGCCSVLNISRDLQGHSSREVAVRLNDKLKAIQANIRENGMELEYALAGLLGGEDLCLISLSNHFAAISEVLSEVQKVTCPLDARTIPILDNSHSILMVDCSGRSCDWGDARAQIFFSSRSKAGFSYLTGVYQALVETNADSKDDISLEGRYGEYDIVLRCPARLLRTELYCGKDGSLSYDNPAYRNAVYQSETIVSPFGCSYLYEAADKNKSIPDTNPADEDNPIPNEKPAGGRAPEPDADLGDIMEQVIKEINRNILGTEEDKYHELTYIHLALYRLQKDYRRIMADPFNVCLHNDLPIQFYTALNAIVVISRSYGIRYDDKISFRPKAFFKQFKRIINALNNTMLIASQVDRFYFSEQLSHLQNTGSYHKILLAYYGFIKDVFWLLYSVERDTGNQQPLLVPLLSFGLTPIAESQSFPSYVNQEDGTSVPAKLICIKLPYQALANPPKYLGILVHEIFHYFQPPRTSSWNKSLVTCLARNAVCEFMGVLATGISDISVDKNYGPAFYRTFSEIVDHAAEKITDEFFAGNQRLASADPETLQRALFSILLFNGSPEYRSYDFYYQIWKNLRRQLPLEDVEEDAKPIISRLLALDKTDDLDRAFADLVRAVPDFHPLWNFLSTCCDALMEITADLFDVGTVLYGKSHDVWAQQFFWQIYTIQSDLLLERERRSLSSRYSVPALLPANSIRLGIFMDYCLGLGQDKSEGMNRFADILKEWCADSKEKDRFDRIQTTFRKDYHIYSAYGSLYTGHEQKFLDIVCASIESLGQNPDCIKIIEKMSGFYRRHCEIMDGLRKEGKNFDLRERGFELCVAFIEAYQSQESVQDLKALPTASVAPIPKSGAVASIILSPLKHPLRKYSESPADLSWAVSSACKEMSIAGKTPLLWYRGQRNKHAKTLPGILRNGYADDASFTQFRQEAHLARTQILPKGADFTKADWLALLQHNGFSTNVLDFSEAFYPALYFAIQSWIDNPGKLPEYDSHITLLNPILFNLAMRALDEADNLTKTAKSSYSPSMALKDYLEKGTVKDGIYLQIPLFTWGEEGMEGEYKYYFSWDQAAKDPGIPKRPIAAFIPKNSERMRQQAGQFVFYDLRRGEQRSMEELCEEYRKLVEKRGLPWIPFLYEVNINRFEHESFADYVWAIGLRKYHVYPELDKLAKDVKQLVRGR